jgi:dTMP kinase
MGARFLALEGIDGAGTTTQSRLLQDWLTARGHPALTTREPSDGPIGTVLRHALGGRVRLPEAAGGSFLTPETIALLFAADRLDHYESEIRPALNKGLWVISDRYLDSSLAYQGSMLSPDWVETINRFAPAPDLTVYLDVDVDVALGRISSTRTATDLFEKRDVLLRVRANYLRLYEQPDRPVRVIAPLPSVKETLQAIVDIVSGAFDL